MRLDPFYLKMLASRTSRSGNTFSGSVEMSPLGAGAFGLLPYFKGSGQAQFGDITDGISTRAPLAE
ncbi:MAG: hypothetical protein JO057_25775 [Chloroflexi bacterium]|nr:hypothetical protein [Chloroflexota bacterium]